MENRRIAPLAFGPEVRELLSSCGLPVDDAGAPEVRLFGCRNDRDRALEGVVGLESYGEVALLRSLAVAESARHTGLGRRLVAFAEAQAAAGGARQACLLTTTAEPFFARLGYRHLPRSEAPPVIAATRQFAVLCPRSAAFMARPLGRSLADLAGLGPRSQAMLERAGIRTVEQLQALGSVAAFAAARRTNPSASLNLLWALEGALTGSRWQDVARRHRTSLLLALEECERAQREAT
jgi:N-acetylglutamate synthase-like GNAT family acetyltransferase